MRGPEELEEEASEPVDTLRCPTCLTILVDGSVKRCPACGSRIRGKGPLVLGADAQTVERPLLLVERELKARIEARTAPRYRQRRRAAKAARRIASLPPSLLEGDITADEVEATAEAAGERFARPSESPRTEAGVVDLPESAIHDTLPPGDVVVDAVAPEVVEAAVPEVVEAAVPEVVEPEVVEPEVVEVVVPEVVEPEVVEPEVVVPEVVEPEVVEPEVVEPEVVEPEVVEVVAAPEPEPEAVEPELVPVDESVPEPEPRMPRVEVSWERESKVWVETVFSHAKGVRKPETVTWPRPRTGDEAAGDLASESS